MSNRFGVWAAAGACLASLAYGVPQVLQVLGILHDPWDRIFIFAPSLVLAPLFVFTMVAVHVAAPPARSVFSLSALALAIMYAVLVSIVYITQLGVVIPHDLNGEGDSVAFLACCEQHQFTTGLDLLGYTFMSVSTLLAAPAVASQRSRWWLVANGALAPFLVAQLAWPVLIWVGALWLITFPVAMAVLALDFAGSQTGKALPR
ncbi:MAG TPA: hypothetical protein VLZ84_03100 [Asticcacaulis sp.]|nr:hypothetical protein [Asticcacaulis sp.]